MFIHVSLVTYSHVFLFPDNRRDISIFHMRVYNIVLSENPPGHARTCDQKLYSDDRQPLPGLGARQSADKRTRSLLLHRVRLQRVVHSRDPSQVHIFPQQMRVREILSKHHRLHSNDEFLHRSYPTEVRVSRRER